MMVAGGPRKLDEAFDLADPEMGMDLLLHRRAMRFHLYSNSNY